MQVKCYYCKSETNKIEKDKAIRIDDKNFHPDCAQKYLDRKELSATICRIFNLKAPGPRNNALVTKYLNEGMTYRGMIYSLVYFYEIKRNDKSKANEGIGIIPYIYEEAKKYYNKDKIAEQKAEAALEKNKEEREQLKNITRQVKWPETKPVTFKMKVYSNDDIEW